MSACRRICLGITFLWQAILIYKTISDTKGELALKNVKLTKKLMLFTVVLFGILIRAEVKAEAPRAYLEINPNEVREKSWFVDGKEYKFKDITRFTDLDLSAVPTAENDMQKYRQLHRKSMLFLWPAIGLVVASLATDSRSDAVTYSLSGLVLAIFANGYEFEGQAYFERAINKFNGVQAPTDLPAVSFNLRF